MTSQKNAPQFLLAAIDGEQQLLIDRELIAGRDPACSIVLDKGQASRQHARFSPADEGILVEDLSSTNGTFVKDQRISEPTLLKAGDEVRIGPARFTVKQHVTAAPVDPDATMLFTPVQPQRAAKKPESSTTAPEPVTDSKAPPSWVLNNQQSVDGTQFISKDIMQSVMAQTNADAAKLQQNVTEPTLIGSGDPIVGMRFQLLGADKNQWEIGRSPKSDIMINHESVSSSHAQIVRDGKRWKLVDLMSANGSFVNGKKCLTGYLSSGDSLRLGSVECMFVLPGGVVAGKAQSKPASRSTAKVAAIAFGVTMLVVAVLWFGVS